MTCLAALSTRCKTRIQYCAHKETLRTTCHAVSSTHSHTHTSFIRTYNTTRAPAILRTHTHTILHTHQKQPQYDTHTHTYNNYTHIKRTHNITHTHTCNMIHTHTYNITPPSNETHHMACHTLSSTHSHTHAAWAHTYNITHAHKDAHHTTCHTVLSADYIIKRWYICHKEETKMIHLQFYTNWKKHTHTTFHVVSSIRLHTHTSVTHTYNIWNKRILITRLVSQCVVDALFSQRNWKKGHTCNIIHTKKKKRYSSYDTSHYVVDSHAHAHAACAHTFNTTHTNTDTHHTTCHTVLSTH